MAERQHSVRIKIDGRTLPEPIKYSVDVDLLQPADAMSLAVPLTRSSWDAAPLDAPYSITIDDVPVCQGFIERIRDNADSTMQIEGRDRIGRLVDESVPGAGFAVPDKLLSDVLLELVSPWYSGVAFSNAEDRRLRRGRGKRARAGREPALTSEQVRAVTRRVEAGTSRWEALERILQPLGLLAWGSADGKTLIVAAPNYSQAPQYDFFETVGRNSNGLSISIERTNAGRYAKVEVSGSGRPAGVPLPPRISTPGQKRERFVSRNRIGIALDGPNRDGTGGDFREPKRLFVVSEMLSTDEAKREAHRILARGLANARVVEVRAPGHGQILDGANAFTLFTVDTVAQVYKEVEAAPGDDSPEVLVNDRFYITRTNFTASRTEEHTTMSLVPLGTLLL